MELIPCLPDDIGLECLIRVRYDRLSLVKSVSRSWKSQIMMPEFWRRRKAAGLSSRMIVLAQARVDPSRRHGLVKYAPAPYYRLTLWEPETGRWTGLPLIPGYSCAGLPMFCQLVGVGSNLVVIGGWDPVSSEVSDAVFVFDFVSAAWRRGADMPGGHRSFFACAADPERRKVFAAGGHNGEKNALRSALEYDVDKDEWTPLPDMARERDECKGIFLRGKFHVIGGYSTDRQGRFERSTESFDAATWQWDREIINFLETAMSPRSCVDGGDGGLHICRGGDVVANRVSGWRPAAKLPADVKHISYVTASQGKLVAFGSDMSCQPIRAFVLDLKKYKWTKVEVPEEFSGHVQSGCCLEL